MAWNERIREAAYTSPSGARFVFNYENVSEVFDKKTASFDFPDADGTFVQDLGNTGRRYPFKVFFWGDDYDLDAEAFKNALLERGRGRLEHPTYGVIDVVPFGTIARRDDLKTGANQAVLQVTFWETIGLIYPTAQADPAKEVLAAVEEYNEVAGEEFADVMSVGSVLEEATFKNTYQVLLDVTENGLRAIAETQDAVRRQFNNIVDSINRGIDVLISAPRNLALQTVQLIQTPARAFASIKARLSAYGELLDAITGGGASVATKSLDSSSANTFHVNDLLARSYVSGSVVSVVNTQFTTKTEALEAAEVLLSQMDALVVWRDANFKSLEEIDTGSSYQQLQEAVALAAGFLVEISFSLKQERSIILDRDRTIIDLSAELYGEVDDSLDFLISSNALTGSEILEIPKGREIVYYI